MNTLSRAGLWGLLLWALAGSCQAEQRPAPLREAPGAAPSEAPAEVPLVEVAPETGNPGWLRDEIARREQVLRNKKQALRPTLQHVEPPKADVDVDRLDRPLEQRRTDPRLQRHVPI